MGGLRRSRRGDPVPGHPPALCVPCPRTIQFHLEVRRPAYCQPCDRRLSDPRAHMNDTPPTATPFEETRAQVPPKPRPKGRTLIDLGKGVVVHSYDAPEGEDPNPVTSPADREYIRRLKR